MNKNAALIALALALAGGLAYLLWPARDNASPPPAPATAAAEATTAHAPPSQPPATMPTMRFDSDPIGPLRLEGMVVDADEQPVPGVLVVLSSNPPKTATSGEDGGFAFDDLVGRPYSLSARADDRSAGPITHVLTERSEPVILKLRKGADVIVEVRDTANAPVAGASVELRALAEQRQVSDGDGVARFRGVGPGSHFAVASAAGLARGAELVQVPEGGAMEIRVRVILQRGAPASGIVVDEDGKPVAGALVVAVPAATVLAGIEAGKDGVTSDARGKFTIPAVAAGSYRFTAIKEGRPTAHSAPIDVSGDSAIGGIEIRFGPSARLSGSVVDGSGTAVPWAQVRVQERGVGGEGFAGEPRQALADEKGSFTIEGLPQRVVAVVAITERAASEIVDVPLDRDKDGKVILRLTIDGVIAGRVVDSSAEPVADAQVALLPDFLAEGSEHTEVFLFRGPPAVRTDPDGNFRFAGLQGGSYRIHASRSENQQSLWTNPTVPARVGDTAVRIVLDPDGGVRGRLLTRQGEAPELFTVIPRFPPGVPVVSKDGRFEVRELTPGNYDVSFQGPDFEEHTVRGVRIRAGEITDLGTITVARGRILEGKVTDAGGAPVAGATVVSGIQIIGDGKTVIAAFGVGNDQSQRIRQSTSDESGKFRLVGVGQKELVVVAEHEQLGRSIARVVPGSSEDADLGTLPLMGFGKVSGKVTMGGEPLAGAQVVATQEAGSGNQVNVVFSGDDGSFVFERLAAGRYQLKALSSALGSALAGSVELELGAGKRITTRIDIEVGDLTLEVTIQGTQGATIDAAQLFLFPGTVDIHVSKELQDQFLKASGGAQMAFALAGKSASFANVKPGPHTICVIPINGDMSDPTFQKRINDNRMTLDVHCKALEVASSPKTQPVAVETPRMSPLPE